MGSLNKVKQEKKYIIIKELHEEQSFPITLLCEVAGVNRSAYYKWADRKKPDLEIENEKIMKDLITLYSEFNGVYGYRRLKLYLDRIYQKKINHKRVHRLMKIAGLKSIIPTKKKNYGKSKPQHVTENILKRNFKADKVNEKWVTDITEFKYGNNKAYLSAILDLYDNSIVSYVISHSNNNQLVFQTLDNALLKSPGATPLLHSDRGFQYTSNGFKQKIKAANITQSMSRAGNCLDNAPIESFFGKLKVEKYYLEGNYQTFKELKDAIDEYIHFYNHTRLQKKLSGLSPIEYRYQYQLTA
ncbi:IS3 family transposase [Proteinivorax hydrogeniformans]|uniref:IS3 family transposase n=1 Tax=Proteinivorax hydrogeniformans TaxID=1826727 RepID=A0AAU8HSD6_9FIRM